MTERLSDNIKRITENVQQAKHKAGRCDTVRIMAVTKTIQVDRINEAIGCGIDLLGENRVQEFLQKHEGYSPDCEIHFIGGLQTNKVRQVVGKVSMIHSVDSIKLAKEIDRCSKSVTDCLIEVNIADEQSKCGVRPEEINELVKQMSQLPMVRLRGLMTIPPYGDSVRYFEKMQRLFEGLKAKSSDIEILSMGMSGDYEDAILHGATIVRLGTALFGIRN